MLLRENAVRVDQVSERHNSHGKHVLAPTSIYIFFCNCGNEIRVRSERLKGHTGRCRKCGMKNRRDRKFCLCGVRAVAKGLCQKHFYEKYKDEISATNKKWNRTLRGRWSDLRRAVRNSGMPSDITREDHAELLALPCVYCGGPLNESGHGLDCKENNLGYLLANVAPCCVVCNRIKNVYLTFEEMKIAMRAVLEYRKTHVHLENCPDLRLSEVGCTS
jgi:predicted RNA-binding Zn-ribbon protein involved in translation (DUF1610 family)